MDEAETAQFDHRMVHSLERLEEMEAAVAEPDIPLRQAIFLADKLASHVHPATPRLCEALIAHARHKDVLGMAHTLSASWRHAAQFFRYEAMSREDKARFYARDGAMLLKKGTSGKLVVLWTTMFNNFYLSNAAMAAMLAGLDCSVLILKDSSPFNYLKGVQGFAPDLFAIGPAIEKLVAQHGFTRIYHASYSSSGYAALYTSLTSPSHGTLTFSPWVDMRVDSPLPPPFFFTEDVRAQVDPVCTFDLKPMLAKADPAIPRTLIYGELNGRDRANARYVEDLDTIDVIAVPGIGHNTILPYLHRGEFRDMFVRLIAG
jgi:hypothetical protein